MNMLNKKIQLELLWWVVTAVLLTVIMYPIWSEFPSFPFNITNTVYVLCLITFARYAFLLKHTFLADWEKGKIAFVLLTLAIIIACVMQLQDFNIWLDNSDPDVLLKTVRENKRVSLLAYIKSEYMFFMVGAVVGALFLGGRLLLSIWRLKNRGKV